MKLKTKNEIEKSKEMYKVTSQRESYYEFEVVGTRCPLENSIKLFNIGVRSNGLIRLRNVMITTS